MALTSFPIPAFFRLPVAALAGLMALNAPAMAEQAGSDGAPDRDVPQTAPMASEPVTSGLDPAEVQAAKAAIPGDLPPASAELLSRLEMPELFVVMRHEGRDYGDQIAEDMFPGGASAGWAKKVQAIYAPERIAPLFAHAFDDALTGEDTGPMRDFLGSELGQKAVSLEVSARAALLDPDLEDSAALKASDMIAGHDPRLQQIETFITTSDLIEGNVAGGLNASLAFWQGLIEGGAYGADVPEERDILDDVWSQEASIRSETRDWLLPYLALAYQPLSDAELDRYTAFYRSEPGQVLNRAIFAGFDAVFVDVSHQLGKAAAGEIAGQDL